MEGYAVTSSYLHQTVEVLSVLCKSFVDYCQTFLNMFCAHTTQYFVHFNFQHMLFYCGTGFHRENQKEPGKLLSSPTKNQ